MKKNYTSWMPLVILFITFNLSFSQSHHTVTFTGNASDFNPEEKIQGSDGVDYYVTFSETTMYFGAFNTNAAGNFNPYDHFTIYLDTDPQLDITAGNGSTLGVNWDNKTPSLPFSANHRVTIRHNNNGEASHYSYNDSGSNWEDLSTIFVQYATANALEIAIDLTTIDNPKGLYFSMFFSYGGGGGGFFGYDTPSYPIDFTDSASSGYFGGIGLISSECNPTEHVNTPILHTLTNANPTPDGKYAYIDINDGYYAVTGDIELVSGGAATIGPGSALTVNGNLTNNGEISLESTSTSYSSLIPTSVDGSGSYFYSRFVNSTAQPGNKDQNDMIAPPLTGQTFGEFAANNPNIFENPNNTSQKLFGPFNKTTGEYQIYNTDIPADANAVLEPGNGYRAAAQIVTPSGSGGPLTFSGTVNTGVVNKPIFDSGPTYKKWNLIGNPYPSYISSRKLINNNLFQLDAHYGSIYGHTGSATNKWTIIDLNEDIPIAPGQGFFVHTEVNGGTITFNPELRIPANGDDFVPLRATDENKAKFQLLLATTTPQTMYTNIYFNDTATLGLDRGYDTGMRESLPGFSIYSQLVEENVGVKLGNQALPYAILSSEVIVPIGIDSTIGQQLTLSASESTLPATVEVYFEDNDANTSTLLNETNHVFTPSGDLSGIGRFTLRFTNKPLSLNNSDLDQLRIYSPKNSGQLIVSGTISEKSTLEIYDLNGRLLQLAEIKSNQTVNRIDVSSLSTGIYIVKIKNNVSSNIKKVQIN